MKGEEILALFEKFEQAATNVNNVECWSARSICPLLGYTDWRNFMKAIEKAKESCISAGERELDHFVGVNKMVSLGSGSQRSIEDVLLTRYACYLIAQNGDPRKQEIAFAQNYFAVQTRRAELVQQRILESERVLARKKLRETESRLSKVVYEHGVDDKGFAIMRSKGDSALFGMPTKDLKTKFGLEKQSKPLADVLPTIGIKAKDLAAEMTSTNVEQKNLHGLNPITREHVDNNIAVREMLRSRGIEPTRLQPAEDVNKVERRLKSEEKKTLPKKK
ncbi:MAG: DNA damage-inducible protein D [Paludibacteraceae bacterium]|nr:DNA damage-inducible protein D [Paludibacteraceae bacterium]